MPSCLSILSNAALIWNTIEIGKIIEQLKLSGEEIKDENIAGISPLIFGH
jgi:TnpA family transposase